MEKNPDYVVISGYSCLDRLSNKTKRVHLRKFVSKKLIEDILFICKDLKEITLPKHISEKISSDIELMLGKRSISIRISESSPGRPNILDNMIKWRTMDYYKFKSQKVGQPKVAN